MSYACRETPMCAYLATCPECDGCDDCCSCLGNCPDCGVAIEDCWCDGWNRLHGLPPGEQK